MPSRRRKWQENSDKWTLDQYAREIAAVCTLSKKQVRRKFRRRRDMDALVILMSVARSRDGKEARIAKLRQRVREDAVADTALKLIRMFPDQRKKDPLSALRSIAQSRRMKKGKKKVRLRDEIRKDAAAAEAFMKLVRSNL
jgi:hypothetical protein